RDAKCEGSTMDAVRTKLCRHVGPAQIRHLAALHRGTARSRLLVTKERPRQNAETNPQNLSAAYQYQCHCVQILTCGLVFAIFRVVVAIVRRHLLKYPTEMFSAAGHLIGSAEAKPVVATAL